MVFEIVFCRENFENFEREEEREKVFVLKPFSIPLTKLILTVDLFLKRVTTILPPKITTP